MDLEQVSRWRDLASKIAAAFCAVALLALTDGLLRHFREPVNILKVLPRTTVAIDGKLSSEARRVEDLTYTSTSDQLTVTFAEIHPGYYLGGSMWRGWLKVGPGISPGKYSLSVSSKYGAVPGKAPDFRIIVFADAHALQQSSPSVVRRWLGLSPFQAAALCLPGILLTFVAVFLLSKRREVLLAAAGKAEIYRVIRTPGGLEIRFGLGEAQGIGSGAKIVIHDSTGRQVGTGTVEVSSQTDAAAQVIADHEIKVGYLVSRG
jgi:hypothetical protein